ncbi:aldehyde dehydrogenase [Gloeophyllum trabeum ATCC 11539]|uniref:Aldehyde dehydrogenase n=1 Tax=Gloeophyllum trabeum (strain ATCC 11539 / FP-39264 / Madison 617) TaxID=670483 RepID=S7RW54_GLOTA|nr:aldehyde dehydrogenase [Gloeophyllum trabeum ATCC 11539]EPQ59090.1 aldehyde dehydrogenase [Gloeophyllum trabeum ATCC 11539]
MKASRVIRIASSLSRSAAYKERYVPFTAIDSLRSEDQQGEREQITVMNPATGEDLCTVVSASQADVKATVLHAHDAYQSGAWSQASVHHRSTVLSRLAKALHNRVPEFAELETLQTGRTIREMRAQLGRLPEWLEYYAALLRTHQAFVAPTQGPLFNYVQRVPLGVVALITPFNHPLLIAIKKIAPALAAGNSVIVKPSELAPISVLEFAEMARDAGIPDGVLSVLPGYGVTTGKDLVSEPLIRKVDITAGTATGRALGSIIGSNLATFTAELGGKAPIIVFDDADVESAVNGAAFASFVASGQTCVSGTRLIVQENIYDAFMARFLDKVKSITRRMGNPLNPQSTMGSVISHRHLERIEKMVKQNRSGNILVGGERMTGRSELDGFDFSEGSFFAPTVIEDVGLEDELWQEEVFGPVVVTKSFSTEDEGVLLANACKYGLGAGIWTTDLSRAHRVAARIQAGLVWVNTHHRNDPSSPWGGMKESGIGRENGIEALEAYSQSKSTIVNIATVEDTRLTDDWFAEGSTAARRYG